MNAVLADQTEQPAVPLEKTAKSGRLSLFSFLTKRKPKGKGRTAIGISVEGVSVCNVVRANDKPVLSICEFRPCMTTERTAVLQELLKETRITNIPVTTVLEPGSYSLHLVDAPNVQPAEMRDAIRWRIKELIDFEIDEAVYDIFDVPGRNLRGQGGKMMYAAVTRASVIQARADQLKAVGLKLKIVDIPELALRNIASLVDDGGGVGILHLSQQNGVIVLTCNDTLFVARNVNIGLNRLRNALTKKSEQEDQEFTAAATTEYHHFLENIILEIQRSLEYYERHSSNPPITKLYIPSMDQEIPGFVAHIKQNLGLTVNVLDLNKIMECTEELSENLQMRLLYVIGAALRDE